MCRRKSYNKTDVLKLSLPPLSGQSFRKVLADLLFGCSFSLAFKKKCISSIIMCASNKETKVRAFFSFKSHILNSL